MGKLHDENTKLRDLYDTDTRDGGAISAVSNEMYQLRQQRLDAMLDAQDKVEAILTPEQRKEVRRFGPWWHGEQ